MKEKKSKKFFGWFKKVIVFLKTSSKAHQSKKGKKISSPARSNLPGFVIVYQSVRYGHAEEGSLDEGEFIKAGFCAEEKRCSKAVKLLSFSY